MAKKFHQRKKDKFKKTQKSSDFGLFQSLELRKKSNKIATFLYFVFSA
jgi:hypothetical protein